MAAWSHKISLPVLKKIFHLFISLAHEIVFNTRREMFKSQHGLV